MSITLDTPVILFDVHVSDPLEFAKLSPSWEGTLGSFWEGNQDDWPTWGQFHSVINDLSYRQWVRFGGGAVGSTTLALASLVQRVKDATRKLYTVERTYMVPYYQHFRIRASSPEQALAVAEKFTDESLDEEGSGWHSDIENATKVETTGMWLGERAYEGEAIALPLSEKDSMAMALRRCRILLMHVHAQVQFTDKVDENIEAAIIRAGEVLGIKPGEPEEFEPFTAEGEFINLDADGREDRS